MSGFSGISSMIKNVQNAVAAAKSAPPAVAPPAAPPPEAAAVPKGDSFGGKTTEPTFDDQGNQTGYVRTYPDGKKEEAKFYPGTQDLKTVMTYNGDKLVSGIAYTTDGKQLATATYEENGISFQEVIYDTDTGEVLTKCGNGGPDPFRNCDPASIAEIKRREAEIDAMRAELDAARQGQEAAAAKDGNKDENNAFKDAD